jgi:predicted homoserine dehydrogenase-like protein
VEVVIDATGSPANEILHALAAIKHGKHIVMVNVDADIPPVHSWWRRLGRLVSFISWSTEINPT